VTIFHILNKGNKVNLPKVSRLDEVGRTNDLNYCPFHRMVHHPTSRRFILKDKIQALVDAVVLTLKSEQKKVTINMVILNFGTFLKMIVQDRSTHVPKDNVNNPMAEKQEVKGPVPMTIKSGEIMWVHPDIAKDEQ